MLAEAYETEEFSRPSSSPLSEENVCDLNGTCNINMSKILQGETSNDDVALTGSTEEFTSRREESSWNMDSNYDDFRKKLFQHSSPNPVYRNTRRKKPVGDSNSQEEADKVGGKEQMVGPHHNKMKKAKKS